MYDEIIKKMDGFASNVEEFKLHQEDRYKTLEAEIVALKASGGSTATKANPMASEHAKAFDGWLRKGREDHLADLEMKALNVTTSADGGYAVPEELDRNIMSLVVSKGSLRGIARTVSVNSGDYKKLVNLRGTASGWVGETSTRPETDTPQFAEIAPPIGEIYANPAITQRMLDDAFFDAEEWIVGEVATEFAAQEGSAFFNGDGTNKPKGFLTYTINVSTDGARTFGDLQMVKTGVAGGFTATTTSTNPVDNFISVVHSLKPELREGATWTMNTSTLETVRKMKDVDGNYIWRPGAERGAPSLLLGYPVLETPFMPDVATNTYPVAFGNFDRGYHIVDRTMTRLLRDPYTNKPYVHFYVTKRLGGACVDSEAIKLLATRT